MAYKTKIKKRKKGKKDKQVYTNENNKQREK